MKLKINTIIILLGLFFIVSAIQPGQAIILGGDDPPTTWAFVLEPIDDDTTRLIIRWRQNYEQTFGNILGWRVFTDPITFVMERKMLQGIKARVEATELENHHKEITHD